MNQGLTESPSEVIEAFGAWRDALDVWDRMPDSLRERDHYGLLVSQEAIDAWNDRVIYRQNLEAALHG